MSEEKLTEFDALIHAAGGLDLAVLGIGDNAHIGFNEPATQYDTRCRVQKLTEKTRMQYSWMFGSAEAVPERACTMGIRTSVIPAAFLQLPFDVTVFADTDAGQKL